MKLSPVFWLFLSQFCAMSLLNDMPGWIQRLGLSREMDKPLLFVATLVLTALATGCAIYWLKSEELNEKD